MSVEKQIASIFCGSNGYLDDLETSHVAQFESEFLAHMERNHADDLKEIVDAGNLSDELIERLHTAVKGFKGRFKREQGLKVTN
jgi:F-type H+-transporting ATPase subunit alpha